MKTHNFPLSSKTLPIFLNDYESLNIEQKQEVMDKIKKMITKDKFSFVDMQHDIDELQIKRLKEYGFYEVYDFSKTVFFQRSISYENIKNIDNVFGLNLSVCTDEFVSHNKKNVFLSPLILFYLIEKNKFTDSNENIIKATSDSLLYAMSYSSLIRQVNNMITQGLVNYKNNGYDEVSLIKNLITEDFFRLREAAMINLFETILNKDELDHVKIIKSIQPLIYSAVNRDYYIDYLYEENLLHCIDWMYQDESLKNILHYNWTEKTFLRIADYIKENRLLELIEMKDKDDMTVLDVLEIRGFFSSKEEVKIKKIIELQEFKKVDDEKQIIERVINISDDTKINKKRL